MAFINELKLQLDQHRSKDNALQMQAYMKDLFPFLGIKAPERKAILKEVVNSNKPELKENCRAISLKLFNLNEREYHYCAIEIIQKFLNKKYGVKDFDLIRGLIISKSHWDTVDFIAKHILGNYILQYWENRVQNIEKLSNADNMWLNRSAILFQLGYKSNTDTDILFRVCKMHASSNEFFIQKAIGWALREYAKTDVQSVIDFTSKTHLKPLSKREALKRIKII